MESFERELKQTFIEEALQLLSDAEECFLALEKNPEDISLIEKIFRLAHNLKGSAKGVGFIEVGEFTHELETLLLKVKKGELRIDLTTISLLLRCNDHLKRMIQGLSVDFDARFDSRDLLAELKAVSTGDARAAAPAHAETAPAPAAEPPGFHMFEDAPVAAMPPPRPVQPQAHAPKIDESIRVSLARVEKLLNYVGEMVILQAVLREQANDTTSMALRKTVHQLTKVTKDVQDLSMGMRMVPMKTLFQKLQRIIRDTAGALEKRVEIHVTGEEAEIDKTVLERISDPLVHLVRNSVDHGVENAETRRASGKNEIGHIHIRAFHQSGRMVIEVEDDGAGLDGEKIRRSAVSKGLIPEDKVLSPTEARDLIFLPGFSTKVAVTDVSGRGVGMDVVKTNIAELSGEVNITSEVGRGTCFRIVLPLTLAIIDGLLATAGGERFVIPLSHVYETVSVKPGDLKDTTGIGAVLMLRGENLPAFELSSLLRMRSRDKQKTGAIGVVVKNAGTPFTVIVDDIVGQLQVVVKQLGRETQQIRGISGSTILGDGRPALILELQDLLKQRAA